MLQIEDPFTSDFEMKSFSLNNLQSSFHLIELKYWAWPIYAQWKAKKIDQNDIEERKRLINFFHKSNGERLCVTIEENYHSRIALVWKKAIIQPKLTAT